MRGFIIIFKINKKKMGFASLSSTSKQKKLPTGPVEEGGV